MKGFLVTEYTDNDDDNASAGELLRITPDESNLDHVAGMTVNWCIARNFAELGVRVFPCREKPGSGPKQKVKTPYGDVAPRGCNSATTDVDEVDNSWSRHPDALPALATGEWFDVIDADTKDGRPGERTLGEVAAAGLVSPDGVVVETPSGGTHVYVPPSGDSILTDPHPSTGRSHGIDYRGTGGYVIAPGAVLPDGGRYDGELGPAQLEVLRAGEPVPFVAPYKERWLNGKERAPGSSKAGSQAASGGMSGPGGDLARVVEALRARPDLGLHDDPGREGHYRARCPVHSAVPRADAHEPSTTSLAVGPGDEANYLVYCHAGCEPFVVLGTLGLTDLARRHAVWALSGKDDGDAQDAEPQRTSFVRVSARELAEPVPPMKWLVRNWWDLNSFGPLGGKKKTLKTYNLLAMAEAVASGEKLFGHFAVENPGPVVLYIAEGGREPFQRRAQRVADAYGLTLEDLPLRVVFGMAPLNSNEFLDNVKRDLDEMQPVLFGLDPLYAYHPADVPAENLYTRGAMLQKLRADVGEDVSMVVPDHFNKSSGSALDLDDIGYAGWSAVANSWVLQGHRAEPELVNGEFQLDVVVGSREWGGARYAVDWTIPKPFDDDVSAADRAEYADAQRIKWSVTASDGAGSGGGSEGNARYGHNEIMNLLVEHVEGRPGETKTDIVNHIASVNHIGDKRVKAAFKDLEAEGLLASHKAKVVEGNREVERPVWRAGDARVRTNPGRNSGRDLEGSE